MSQTEDPIRVLHVDDEPKITSLTADFLENITDSITVETTRSPPSGLDKLSEGEFDCVVSDYDMPQQDGIEFLDTVRNEHDDLPFILFTGKGSEEIASRAISNGVTDYLQKGMSTDRYQVLANRITNAASSYRRKQRLRQYRTAVETAGDAIYALDKRGHIQMVNRACVEFVGASRQELIDTHISEWIRDDVVQEGTKSVIELLNDETRDVISYTFEEASAEGKGRIYQNKISIIENDEGEHKGSAGVIRDITEQHRQRRELARQKEQIKKFINVAAYDLRRPLHAAQREIDKGRGEITRNQLETIDTSLTRIEEIADSLERASTDQTELDPGPTEIEATAKTAWSAVDTAGATLTVDTDAVIDADEQHLQRLFGHLFRDVCRRAAVVKSRRPGDFHERSEGSLSVCVDHIEPIYTGTRTATEPDVAGFYVQADASDLTSDTQEFPERVEREPEDVPTEPTMIKEIVTEHGWNVHKTKDGDTLRFDIHGVDSAT